MTIGVDYTPASDSGLPARMMLKTLLLHPGLRFEMPAINDALKARAEQIGERSHSQSYRAIVRCLLQPAISRELTTRLIQQR